ncbi:phospholipase D-like domain-containing protein [Vicingaceae bacterium]|nr:phospholipase D-like domain-containing protein [Vicingaceae bacterium]
MEEVIELIKASITDHVLISSEKKNIKKLISSKKFNKREMDFLRSQIFDIAKNNQEELSKESLIEWIESTNKLTLINKETKNNNSYAYFSPGKSCRNAIIQQIKLATESLKICVFTISDNDISREIIAAHKKGINVKIITDNDKSFDLGSDIEQMANNGIDTKIDNSPNHMHHKFCIIDKDTLITGSYNWTRSAAERNQENILINKEPQLIKSYLKEFEKLWKHLHNY